MEVLGYKIIKECSFWIYGVSWQYELIGSLVHFLKTEGILHQKLSNFIKVR